MKTLRIVDILKWLCTMGYILSHIGLIACGSVQSRPAQKESALELEPYIQYFEDLTNVRVMGILYFNDQKPGVAGTCHARPASYWIEIDKERWDRYTELQRLYLVLHELGHCALGYDHDNTEKNGCPTSLMYDTVISNLCLEQNWEAYLENF